MSLVPDPADRGPGSGNVNKVWDFRGCLSLLFDKGDKCKDLEPGEPPPAEAEEDLRRITGGTKKINHFSNFLNWNGVFLMSWLISKPSLKIMTTSTVF